MKSLLVDAMRQANEDDKGTTLSDSGSFDTTSDQFSETANDAVVETPPPLVDDLQLMDPDASGNDAMQVETLETDASLLPDLEVPDSGSGREVSAQIAACDVALSVVGRAPRLSRFSPLICLALFFSAGLAWAGWQYWVTQAAGSLLSATRIPGTSAQSAASDADVGSGIERFPFITAALPADDVEAPE